jgi:multisubunit Na+/H+ antiporter MnhF subunit
MSGSVMVVLNVLLLVMVGLLPFAFYRVWIGRGIGDRMLGLEMISTLLVGISILLALVSDSDMVIDVGIILAALGFAGTISIARYVSEGRLF